MIIEHLLIAAQLVTAAVKGDVATPDAKEKEWYRNADDIAIFLRGSTKNVLHTFSFNKKGSRNYVQKNYQEDIQVFDAIEAEALAMSDMIASAIVMQFYYLFY